MTDRNDGLDLLISENGSGDALKKEISDEWRERRKNEREEVFRMIDEASLEAVKGESEYRAFLSTMSAFPENTAANCLLIYRQRPGAVRLETFERWKQEGARVSRNEKAVTIMAREGEYTRSDGTTGVSIGLKKVFDISQTSAKPADREEKAYDEKTAIKALMAESPVDIRIADDLRKNVTGAFSKKENAILIRPGLDASCIFRTLAFEIITARQRQAKEIDPFAAHTEAYLLCGAFGFDNAGFDLTSVARRFDGMSPKEIRGELEKIRTETNRMRESISRGIEYRMRAESERENVTPDAGRDAGAPEQG